MGNPIDDLYDTIQVLNQIKNDIGNIRYTWCGTERKEPYDIKDEALAIVEKHIAKLQGEEDDE